MLEMDLLDEYMISGKFLVEILTPNHIIRIVLVIISQTCRSNSYLVSLLLLLRQRYKTYCWTLRTYYYAIISACFSLRNLQMSHKFTHHWEHLHLIDNFILFLFLTKLYFKRKSDLNGSLLLNFIKNIWSKKSVDKALIH